MLYEKAQYDEFNVPTCGKIAVWQPCRERQPFWNSHDGLNLTCLDQCHVWINAMVFVPMAQAPPKAGAKDLSYKSLNLIHEFTSLFSRKVIVAGLPRKAFPQKYAFVDISVFLCLRKQQPRFAQGQPKGYFLTKELDRTTEAFARMNVVWEGPVCWVQCANMWQHCSLTAVQRKTAFLEQSWWPEFKMFGSMPRCSFPWHKLLPRLAQKTCHTTV